MQATQNTEEKMCTVPEPIRATILRIDMTAD